jgi:hypothetical protein
MNNINAYIIEKLKINKDSKLSDNQYSNKFGKGELTIFKDCDIYKVYGYGLKNIHKEYENRNHLYENINKYFNDDDKIWLVTETAITDSEMPAKLALEIKNAKPIIQSIDLYECHQGYILKKLENDQIVLIIKYLRKSGKLWQTKWLFKI